MVRRRTALADTLRQRIFSGLHLGTLSPGDRLPSVRDLARELEADPRSILTAVREMEKEGLVELRQRSGIYVAEHVMTRPSSPREADWIADLLVEGLSHDVSGPRFAEHIRRYLDTVRIRVACIECNHDQNAQLCGELHDDYGLDAQPVDLYDLFATADAAAVVRQADLLVTSQFHANQIRPLAAELGKPLIIAPLQTGLFAGIADLMTKGPVYVVVSDVRFADKLRDIFKSSPGADNLHPLVLGTYDLGQVSSDAPVYVTDRAQAMLPERSRWKRALPQIRAFSPETARQLFSFIVRANLGPSDSKNE